MKIMVPVCLGPRVHIACIVLIFQVLRERILHVILWLGVVGQFLLYSHCFEEGILFFPDKSHVIIYCYRKRFHLVSCSHYDWGLLWEIVSRWWYRLLLHQKTLLLLRRESCNNNSWILLENFVAWMWWPRSHLTLWVKFPEVKVEYLLFLLYCKWCILRFLRS